MSLMYAWQPQNYKFFINITQKVKVLIYYYSQARLNITKQNFFFTKSGSHIKIIQCFNIPLHTYGLLKSMKSTSDQISVNSKVTGSFEVHQKIARW